MTLTWNDAAVNILRKERKPLKYTELAKKILKSKLVRSKSKNPGITLYASIILENQAREGTGRRPRFTIAHGEVDLVKLPVTAIQNRLQSLLETTNQDVKKEFLRRLLKLPGSKFESFIEALLINMGYKQVEVHGGPTDEGIDLLCEMAQGINQVKTGVQAKCKQPHNKIGPRDVRLLRDVLPKFKCAQGVLITTSDFTPEAKAAALEEGRPVIILIDGSRLVDLAVENRVGVKLRHIRAYSLDEDFPLFK